MRITVELSEREAKSVVRCLRRKSHLPGNRKIITAIAGVAPAPQAVIRQRTPPQLPQTITVFFPKVWADDESTAMAIKLNSRQDMNRWDWLRGDYEALHQYGHRFPNMISIPDGNAG